MTEEAKKERVAISAATRKILESIKGNEPFIALAAMTTVMSSVIVSSNSPHSDEEILKTADSALRKAVKIMRMSEVKGMVKQ